jgi:hypothetical protein
MNRYGSRNDQHLTSVVDPHHVDADPDSTFHPDGDPDPDPDPSFQIKAQTIEKAHIPYILACHLQIDADPVPDPAYHFLMRIWIFI